MRRVTRYVLGFLAPSIILLALCGSLLADQVALRNGDRLSGTIISSDGKELTLKTEFAGEVKIQWSAITTLTSEQTLHLALKNGQVVAGTVTTSDGSFVVATKAGENVTAARESVTAIRNDAEEAIYERDVLHPRLIDLWSGLVDTGLSLTRGNSNTLNYNFSGKAARISARDKITAYLTSVYASNSTTGPSTVTASDIRSGLSGDLNFRPHAFVFATADFEHNRFEDLNLRSVAGGGLGYHLIERANTTLDVNAGADYENESFFTFTRRSGEIQVGEAFATKMGPRFTLSENFVFYPDMSSLGQYRFLLNATAATKLKTWLGWQITFSDSFLSDPVPGLKDNDAILSTGLRVAFGKAVF
jgi:putative salt-induced outer membrane protein YdiY